MQITAEEMKRRLNSSKNIANRNILKAPSTTFKVVEIPSKKNTPAIKNDVLRTVLGSLAAQGESITEIAREFNVTTQQVTSARDTKVPAIAVPRQASLDRVRELALDKLMQSLNLMTTDKFESADLKTLSTVAANTARVVEKLSPKETTSQSQLVIYAPQIKSESKYKVIDV